MTEKNHTQKKTEKHFSTDVDVSDYGESKSAIKKNRKTKHTPQATFQSRELFFYHIYINICETNVHPHQRVTLTRNRPISPKNQQQQRRSF
jgi:hypothetical protein